MLSSSLAYIITRSLPESILFMLAGYILLDLKLDKVKILKIGLLLGIIVSFIRNLPINYGIHSVLSMISGGFLLARISKLPIIQPVIATCCIFIALALSEGIYVGIATGILNKPMEVLMAKDLVGAIITMPSLLIFILLVIIMKIINNKIKLKSKVS